MFQRLILAVTLAFAGVGFACDLEKKIDCGDICRDFQDCLGGVDTSECEADCEAQPEDEIDECDACLDDMDNGCADCLFDCISLTI